MVVHRWVIELIPEAEAELKAIPADIRARFIHISGMIAESGPHHVGMPHVRHLEGRPWEMRMKGRDGIARAVYVAQHGCRLTVIHVFAKKTQKTPRRAIEIAMNRMRTL
ncbi:type II toxin-antitoxin system RelE/ParE family toxin [Methylococcus mesophilus]|uniref:type II toxin-antitoxin system RelE/ParE family toxin n=1 Tax=Methylococcus mesophilus TaxID=2993564 RepID=UPI00224B6C82|nr:type II toxin-antitoxin system RelE/ParE family toxin [Methylococcus mesophilus]UZR29773.1 type II toxin-antitoxin system RelE/ParE family toxin [Methylococcus mesophilus]